MIGMTLGELLTGDDEWDPIAIAPKDGEHLLVCCRDGTRHVAWWNGATWTDSGGRHLSPVFWMTLPDAPPMPVRIAKDGTIIHDDAPPPEEQE